MSDQSLEGFWVSIAAGVLLLVLDAGLKFAYQHITRGNPLHRKHIILFLTCLWVVLNGAYIYYVVGITAAAVILLSSIALAWIVRSELNQFWRIGLVGADAQIQSGITFDRALNLVSNSLDFL